MMVLPSIEENPLLQDSSVGLDFKLSDVLPEAAKDILIRSPVSSIFRAANLDATERFSHSKTLTPDEYKSSEYFREGVKFPNGVKEDVAKLVAERKDAENERAFITSKAPPGILNKSAVFGTQLVSAMLDPLNVATAFVPVVREARFASLTAKIGLTGARGVRGVTEGAVGAALVEPIILAAARQEQADYDFTDSLINVGFGSVFGGGIHIVGGKVHDIIKQFTPETREQLLKTAVAQAIEGKKINVEPIARVADDIEVDPLLRSIEKANLKNIDDVENLARKIADDVNRQSITKEELVKQSDELQTEIDRLRDKKVTGARLEKRKSKEIESIEKRQKSLQDKIKAIDEKEKELDSVNEEIKKTAGRRPRSEKGKLEKQAKLAELNKRKNELTEAINPKKNNTLKDAISNIIDQASHAKESGNFSRFQETADQLQGAVNGQRKFRRYENEQDLRKDIEANNARESDAMYDADSIELMDGIVKKEVNLDQDVAELDDQIKQMVKNGILNEKELTAYKAADDLIREAEKLEGITQTIAVCAARQ